MSVSDDTSVLTTYIHTSVGYMTFKYTEKANTKLVVNRVFMISQHDVQYCLLLRTVFLIIM